MTLHQHNAHPEARFSVGILTERGELLACRVRETGSVVFGWSETETFARAEADALCEWLNVDQRAARVHVIDQGEAA
jgi:hypothetical protein